MKNLLLPVFIFLISCSNKSESDYLSLDVNTASLSMMNYELTKSNDRIVDQLKTSYPELDSIRTIRVQLVKSLHSRANNLITYCGGLNENGMLWDPYAKPIVNDYLLEQNAAQEMQQEINDLMMQTEKIGLIVWRPIRDAKDIPIFKNDPNQREKTFAELNFTNRNLYQVINTFEQLELGILIDEQTFIAEYLAKEKSM